MLLACRQATAKTPPCIRLGSGAAGAAPSPLTRLALPQDSHGTSDLTRASLNAPGAAWRPHIGSSVPACFQGGSLGVLPPPG